ncbi:MAG TPA: hypothetical protein VLN41_01920 [Candidatus Bathyarchaeia archaeon]|nr:hypothetical protein [Candidatus Bathyarchaeia archaeon]
MSGGREAASLVLISSCLFLFAVPGRPQARPAGPAVAVHDDLGRPFMLPAATPRRIVSMAPNITELLFALGLGAGSRA